MTPREAAHFLAAYAKRFSAGAFATPTADELARQPGQLEEWREGPHRTVAVTKWLRRPSKHRDFTGAPYLLPPGPIVTHLARSSHDAPVPDLGAFNFVFGYVEDAGLSAALRAQGREPAAVQISAASEIRACWARAGMRKPYPPWDVTTVAEMDHFAVPGHLRALAEAGAHAEAGWYDDFPYYSDGSWAAVNLRGFRPDDPTYGIKPSEMPRPWRMEHPEALAYRCGWTPAAERHAALVEVVSSVPWWATLERVRLLRMAGRGGKGGKLSRHTDITDRSAGTRDGQIARFHVPLVTHPDVAMHCWELDGTHRAVHLAPWRCYYLDARKPHAVINPTGVDRVHLVVDVVVDAAVRARLA